MGRKLRTERGMKLNCGYAMRWDRALLAVKVDFESALSGVQHEPTVLATFEMLAEIDDDLGRKSPLEIITNGANGGPASHRYVPLKRPDFCGI